MLPLTLLIIWRTHWHLRLVRIGLNIALIKLLKHLPGRQVQLVKLMLLQHKLRHLHSLNILFNVLLQVQLMTLLHKVQRVAQVFLQLGALAFLVEWRHGRVFIQEIWLTVCQFDFTHVFIEEFLREVHVGLRREFGREAVLLEELGGGVVLFEVALVVLAIWVSEKDDSALLDAGELFALFDQLVALDGVLEVVSELHVDVWELGFEFREGVPVEDITDFGFEGVFEYDVSPLNFESVSAFLLLGEFFLLVAFHAFEDIEGFLVEFSELQVVEEINAVFLTNFKEIIDGIIPSKLHFKLLLPQILSLLFYLQLELDPNLFGVEITGQPSLILDMIVIDLWIQV